MRMEYRRHSSGAITDMAGTEVKNTNNLSLKEIASRAKANGFKVETYNAKQLTQYDKERNADREAQRKFAERHDTKDRSSTYRAPRKGFKGH